MLYCMYGRRHGEWGVHVEQAGNAGNLCWENLNSSFLLSFLGGGGRVHPVKGGGGATKRGFYAAAATSCDLHQHANT